MDAEMARNSPSSLDDVYDSEEMFHLLERLGRPESVPKGTYFYQTGQSKLPDVILLLKGSVKACQLTAAGEEQIYNIFRGGSELFLLAAVTNKPPALSFVTTSPCQIIRVPNGVVRHTILTDSRLARTLLADFAAKLTFSYKRLRECESYNTEWKLCNMLLSLADRSGVEYEGKVLIKEKISQQTMASMLRISRITVARTLKALRDFNLIETINGYICIRDEAALVQHMHYISIPLE